MRPTTPFSEAPRAGRSHGAARGLGAVAARAEAPGRCASAAWSGPSWVSHGHIPCLDGVRAVAIILVLWVHAIGTEADSPAWLELLARQGTRGVDLFFVLSGFLITLLLLRERGRTGGISLRDFYCRRSLRILPAYVAYLAFVGVLSLLGRASLTRRDWLSALTYTSSLPPQEFPAWEITHTWSLSVEEHFYLIWPLVVAACRPAHARNILLAALVLIPGVRYLVTFPLHDVVGQLVYLDIDYCTITRMDTIGMGCLLAVLAYEPRFWRLAGVLRGRSVTVIALAVLVLAASTAVASGSRVYAVTFKRTLDSALIAVMILAVVTNADEAPGRLLRSRVMTRLGVLSYSIYLWQQPFLMGGKGDWMSRWPVNLALVLAASILCHRLIEAPFLRWKDRLRPAGG